MAYKFNVFTGKLDLVGGGSSSVTWGSITGTQSDVLLSGFTNDLGNYGGFLTDAPSDGNTYGRKNANWEAISSGFTNPMTTLGDIIYENGTPTADRLPGNTTTTQKFLSQTGDGVNSAAPSWQVIPAQGRLTYYLQDTASDLAGAKKELTTPLAVETSVNTAGLSSGNTLLQTWITEPNVPNLTFIPAGMYEQHIHAAKTTGVKTAVLYAEIWEANSAGADITKIGTTEVSGSLGTKAEYSMFFSSANVYTMGSTASRIKVKIYTTISGAGSAPTVFLYYGGTSDSFTGLPSNTVDATNFVPYSGATQNVNLGTKALIEGFSAFTATRTGAYISSVVRNGVTYTVIRTGAYISSIANGSQTLTLTRSGGYIASGAVT